MSGTAFTVAAQALGGSAVGLPGAPDVALFTVLGGGHVIPGLACASIPDSAGPCEARFDGVAQAVRFFLAPPLTGSDERAGSERTEPKT